MNYNPFLKFLSVILLLIFIGCTEEKEPIAVTGVTLSQTSLEMTEGEVQTLSTTIQPSNAENKSVSWTSSDPSVASVHEGSVTAHRAGSATITVKTIDGGKEATCSVIVAAKFIAVTGISLEKASTELDKGDEITLITMISPNNATNKNVTWTSSDESVATVDNGKVTAVKEGIATITVTTEDGSKTDFCQVLVRAVASIDYIDEYGINNGKGIAIGSVVWAPVNCGYHSTDFKYGKLYQWGRKHGQGYNNYFFDGDWNQRYNDTYTPELRSTQASLSEGQSADNENIYYHCSDWPYNWCTLSINELWNMGTEENPIKSEYDPCPTGWRVPTHAELEMLCKNYSPLIIEDDINGCWFSGTSVYSEIVPQVFFPTAGCRNIDGYPMGGRGRDGFYWSSTPSNEYYSYCLSIDETAISISTINFKEVGYSVRCVQDNKDITNVLSVSFDKNSLSMGIGETYTISTTVNPSNANHKSAYLWSDDASIVTIDQNGKLTAISAGTTTINAIAGMQTAHCLVSVNPVNKIDYLDEYGINHGQGIEFDGTVWAPVNCGYHASDYKYGKLYQWGRKYGQGYSGPLLDSNGNDIGKYADVTLPEIVEGPVSLSIGQSKSNESKFYYSDNSFDWISPQDNKLWNSGSENNPIKTEYDPCPEGWRVPTRDEFRKLKNSYMVWTTNQDDQTGYWISEFPKFTTNVPYIFIPAAGYRMGYTGIADCRGSLPLYWSSSIIDDDPLRFNFNSPIYGSTDYKTNACSVRCVQE